MKNGWIALSLLASVAAVGCDGEAEFADAEFRSYGTSGGAGTGAASTVSAGTSPGTDDGGGGGTVPDAGGGVYTTTTGSSSSSSLSSTSGGGGGSSLWQHPEDGKYGILSGYVIDDEMIRSPFLLGCIELYEDAACTPEPTDHIVDECDGEDPWILHEYYTLTSGCTDEFYEEAVDCHEHCQSKGRATGACAWGQRECGDHTKAGFCKCRD